MNWSPFLSFSSNIAYSRPSPRFKPDSETISSQFYRHASAVAAVVSSARSMDVCRLLDFGPRLDQSFPTASVPRVSMRMSTHKSTRMPTHMERHDELARPGCRHGPVGPNAEMLASFFEKKKISRAANRVGTRLNEYWHIGVRWACHRRCRGAHVKKKDNPRSAWSSSAAATNRRFGSPSTQD